MKTSLSSIILRIWGLRTWMTSGFDNALLGVAEFDDIFSAFSDPLRNTLFLDTFSVCSVTGAGVGGVDSTFVNGPCVLLFLPGNYMLPDSPRQCYNDINDLNVENKVEVCTRRERQQF